MTVPFGMSRETETYPVSHSIDDTIPAIIDRRGNASSSARVSTSCCAPTQAMLFSSGAMQLTARTDKPASNVHFSGAKARGRAARSLCDRLTPLLISSGLVAGITPTSVRQMSGAAIRDTAFLPLAGGGAGERQKDSSSWSGSAAGEMQEANGG